MCQVQNVSQSMEVVDLRTSRDLQYVRDSEPLLRGVDGRLHTYVTNPRSLTAKGLQVHTHTHKGSQTPRHTHSVRQLLWGTHNLWCENIDFTHAKLKFSSCTQTRKRLSSKGQNLSWSCRFADFMSAVLKCYTASCRRCHENGSITAHIKTSSCPKKNNPSGICQKC